MAIKAREPHQSTHFTRQPERSPGNQRLILFLGGQFFSLTGSYMQSVALAWLVYRTTRSPLLLGFLGFCTQIPVLFLAPIAGIVADRKSRRRILLATQASAMVVSYVLAGLTITGLIRIWQIYLLAALSGCSNAFDFPARQAFLAEIAGKQGLSSAIPLNSSITNAGRVLGPALAGLIVASRGEAWCFFANGVSYLPLIVALSLMRGHKSAPRSEPAALKDNIKDWRVFLRKNQSIRALLLLLALVSFMGIRYDILMPVFAASILHAGSRGYGILMAMSAAGAVGASLVLAGRKARKGLGQWVGLSSAGLGIGLILFGLSKSFWLSATLLLGIGFSMAAELDATTVSVQTLTPERLRGRAMALWTMTLTGIAPFGSLVAGWLGGQFGAPRALAASGLGCLMGAVVFGFCLPRLRPTVA